MTSITPPSLGRIVCYTVRDGQRRGTPRAAIITGVSAEQPFHVSLTVFPDQADPAMHEERYAASAGYDADGKPGTWRYFAPVETPAPVQTPVPDSLPPAAPDIVAEQAEAEASADPPPAAAKPAKPKK